MAAAQGQETPSAAPSADMQPSTAQSSDASPDKAGKKEKWQVVPPTGAPNAVLWKDPGNIAALNLFEGQGGPDHHPQPPLEFVEEDKNGSNPKFDIADADGNKWRVKVGAEARPEVVASRLLWAVGYFANDDYFVHGSQVSGVHMERQSASIHSDGQIINARYERRPGKEKKIGIWQWKNNPFIGSREFNGLRVMMAMMNGWDLKDENNAVYQDEKTGQQIYLASDIGATFGTNGLAISRSKGRGNVESFEKSKFITRTSNSSVDFATPSKPTSVLLVSLGFTITNFAGRAGMEWIGRDIPTDDVRWIASLLGQLSHQQLEDAFRAGGFNQASAMRLSLL